MIVLDNVDTKKATAIRVVYCGTRFTEPISKNCGDFFVHHEPDIHSLNLYLNNKAIFDLPDVIFLEADDKDRWVKQVEKLKKNPLLKGLIIILLADKKDAALKRKALDLKVHDLYFAPLPVEDLCERIKFLIKFKLIRPQMADLEKIDIRYKMSWTKRMFDVLFSGLLLLLLLPFFLIIAIIIRLESKGPVIYKSKRVGTGYKIFYFYKFRSMRSTAQTELAQLAALNQYAADGKGATFIKLKNDPRVTRVGSFLRKTSIDELPQLFNVLIGDMSVVGNRPLPLYEAEQLTSNEWTMRFLGPAGITGLWQVSRRGKEEMSERERKKLDNFYAQKYSFWLDLKILISTFPALLQKEKV